MPIFCFFMGMVCHKENFMNRTKYLTHAAIIGAMYFALTHLQNLLVPNSATWLIQFRASEALCVLALFTPAAIPGLTIGCLLFNISFAGALPLDFLVGSFASFLACGTMWMLRRWPGLALSMPALFNGLLVGWELTLYFGETGFTMSAFWISAIQVAIGELAVLYTLGLLLYRFFRRNGMSHRLFGTH